MRRFIPKLPTVRLSGFRLAGVLLAGLVAGSSVGPAVAQPAAPPHAWLFGTWTGGMFPPPANMTAQACLSQPVVIFTRDLVMRATITEQVLTQREIESARSMPGGAEFRFTSTAPVGSGMLRLGAAPAAGFGCETPDVLHVQKRGENEIAFPGCADFPNPLVRCHTR
jgi:hypothetical protein